MQAAAKGNRSGAGEVSSDPQQHDRGDPDPYPNYRWLRSQAAIHPIPGAREGSTTWLVTSFEQARQCLNEPRLSADSAHAAASTVGSTYRRIGKSLLNSDPPDHTRLRQLVSGAFSQRAAEALRPKIARICHRAIDSFANQGEADLVRQYAVTVPVAVIHDVLGIPESKRTDPGRCLALFFRVAFVKPQDPSAVHELEDYLDQVVAYKRLNRGDDVVTKLLDGLESGVLRTERELYGMLYVLLGAGHTTTVPFLGAAMLRLLERRRQWQQTLLDEPALLRSFIEEVFRHDSAVQASQNRHALEDIEIDGTRVSKGDTVLISLAAANRDPARFDRPDEFCEGRRSMSHLSFGHGIHFCLGAHLARAEAEVALRTLLTRIPTLRLAGSPADVAWSLGPMLRGPRELSVTFQPA